MGGKMNPARLRRDKGNMIYRSANFVKNYISNSPLLSEEAPLEAVRTKLGKKPRYNVWKMNPRDCAGTREI